MGQMERFGQDGRLRGKVGSRTRRLGGWGRRNYEMGITCGRHRRSLACFSRRQRVDWSFHFCRSYLPCLSRSAFTDGTQFIPLCQSLGHFGTSLNSQRTRSLDLWVTDIYMYEAVAKF